MSEKDKKEQTAPAEETAQETAEQTAAPADEAAQEETFTVTKSQMEQMEQLAKVLADANDKYLRLAAEYDNYRKRTTREKEHVYDTAKADTIKPFLAVLDNLERAAIRGGRRPPAGAGADLQAVHRGAEPAGRH